MSVLSGVAMLVFKEREVFDEMHQKRLFVIHMENVRALSPCFPGFLAADSLISPLRYVRPRRVKTTCSSEVPTLHPGMKASRTLSLKDSLRRV